MRAFVDSGLTLAVLATLAMMLDTPADAQKAKPTRNVEVTAEQEKLRDPEGYAAIKELHRLMDDDQSGSIDRFESADFLAEDLKIGGNDRARREKAFHHNNDDSITVDDLWEAWFQSEIRDWDEKEAADWLKYAVKLPQYGNNFLVHHVNGIVLPRLAIQNSSYIQQLGIKNFVHRQKLQLKALDLVLFGVQDLGSPWKDIALGVCVVGLVTLLIVFKVHKRQSRREMEELTSRFSELKNMESDFEGTQQKLDDERKRRRSTVETENRHIEALKNQLLEAERRIEMSSGIDSLTYALQPLLRRTYECESTHINQQKLDCLSEMREATEFVDKMRRKQGLLTSFKLATGTNSGTDDIDNRIFNLKARMEKIKASMDECGSRWIEIESMCGFSIVGSFGVHHHAGLGAPMMNGEGHHHLAHHSQKTSAMMVGGLHRGGGSYGGPVGAVASSIPPSVQSALYDEFNNGSTASSQSSAVNSAPPYHPMGIAQQETSSSTRSEAAAVSATRDAARKPAVNEDTSSLSSSNGKSSKRSGSKISDLITGKWKTKPSSKDKTN